MTLKKEVEMNFFIVNSKYTVEEITKNQNSIM